MCYFCSSHICLIWMKCSSEYFYVQSCRVEYFIHQKQLSLMSKANFISLFSFNIKRENFPVFDMITNGLIRGDGHWKISFACWLTIFTTVIEYVFMCLWSCIGIFYWGNWGVESASGKRYHRLKVNVFVTLAFFLFCGGIINCITSKLPHAINYSLTFAQISSKRCIDRFGQRTNNAATAINETNVSETATGKKNEKHVANSLLMCERRASIIR